MERNNLCVMKTTCTSTISLTDQKKHRQKLSNLSQSLIRTNTTSTSTTIPRDNTTINKVKEKINRRKTRDSPFRCHDKENFPNFDDAISTIYSRRKKIKDDVSLNLSIGTLSALTEHRRHVMKYGFDTALKDCTNAFASSSLQNQPCDKIESSDDDWNRLMDDTSSSILSYKSFKSDFLTDDDEVTDDDFFNSSRVNILLTPERDKQNVENGVTFRNADISSSDYASSEEYSDSSGCGSGERSSCFSCGSISDIASSSPTSFTKKKSFHCYNDDNVINNCSTYLQHLSSTSLQASFIEIADENENKKEHDNLETSILFMLDRNSHQIMVDNKSIKSYTMKHSSNQYCTKKMQNLHVNVLEGSTNDEIEISLPFSKHDSNRPPIAPTSSPLKFVEHANVLDIPSPIVSPHSNNNIATLHELNLSPISSTNLPSSPSLPPLHPNNHHRKTQLNKYNNHSTNTKKSNMMEMFTPTKTTSIFQSDSFYEEDEDDDTVDYFSFNMGTFDDDNDNINASTMPDIERITSSMIPCICGDDKLDRNGTYCDDNILPFIPNF